MHRPSDDSGILVAFRREAAAESVCTVRLGGIDLQKDYLLKDIDTAAERRVSGRELRAGLTLALEHPKSSLLLKYKAL